MVNLIFYVLINTIVRITPIRVPNHVEATKLAGAMLLQLVPCDLEAQVVLSHIYATSEIYGDGFEVFDEGEVGGEKGDWVYLHPDREPGPLFCCC